MMIIQNAWNWEVIILLILILLILFGSRKIPEVARSLGEAVREFRKAMSETEQIQQQIRAPAQTQQSFQEDPLIDLARRKGINIEGKTRVQIVEELAKKIREEESFR